MNTELAHQYVIQALQALEAALPNFLLILMGSGVIGFAVIWNAEELMIIILKLVLFYLWNSDAAVW